jgi:hypothetical protein
MDYINAINFAPFPRKGVLGSDNARISLEKMARRTGSSHVILSPAGLQEHPQAVAIDFSGPGSAEDGELKQIIGFAQGLGLKVILKPTVNCKNGVWRAYINFLDHSIAEEAWKDWFDSHEKFQLHYAKIAQETGCVMFIAGCEMVMSERRDREWRETIAAIKGVFPGPVSYNTDKFQEDRVSWWDCVDVISSSGYYPSGTWESHLDRIEGVVKRFAKPFFFAEIGAMSTRGSKFIPNSWQLEGAADPADQEEWYEEMFEHTKRRPWVEGYGLWSWGADLYDPDQAGNQKKYDLYGKPAEQVVRRYFGAPGAL